VDLTPAQQKAVFVLVVVVLAALGYWLLLPKLTHTGSHAQAATTPAATSTPTTPAAAAGSSGPAANSAPPVSTASPTAGGTVNIYSWLPFTQQDLAAAAAVTVRFGVDYNTFTYTESSRAYVAKMNGLITGQLATQLQAEYATPGVASLRTGQQQISTGTATITSLRAFGPSSLTFVVTAGQHLVSSHKTSEGSTQYAITVVGVGGGWQVDDIELSSAGNS
jgi:hypothetical protein